MNSTKFVNNFKKSIQKIEEEEENKKKNKSKEIANLMQNKSSYIACKIRKYVEKDEEER